MKKHFVIFVIIFIVTIGYAAVNIVLDIKASIDVAENIEDFKIEITNLKINNNDSKTLISKDKKSFTFTGSGNDTINYTVTNYSYQYDANIILTCVPSDDVSVEQINNLSAQERSTKSITSTSTSEVTCTINVEKISRTDYAEDMCIALEGTEWTFDYTGSEQEFSVPCDGNYKIELWGAQGGSISESGGRGAYTFGAIAFRYNSKLYIYVGEKGENGSNSSNYNPKPSFNGGNSGANCDYSLPYGSAHVSASGGGATDVRLLNGSWSDFTSLKSRIMVAAGGGGKAFPTSVPGCGGGINGGDSGNSSGAYGGVLGATGANQTLGGRTSQGTTSGNPNWKNGNNGAFGYGGSTTIYTHPGGGGGGGYYGGAGGGSGFTSMGGASGSGGSSFISGHNGCDAIAENSTQTNIIHTGQPNHYSGYVFTDTVMVDGAGYKWTNVKGEQTGMPTHDGTETMMGNSGNGYARITYLGKS